MDCLPRLAYDCDRSMQVATVTCASYGVYGVNMSIGYQVFDTPIPNRYRLGI